MKSGITFERTMPVVVRGRVVPGILVAFLLGCSDATAPPVEVRPELRRLAVDDFASVLTDSGLIRVSALPRDSLYRLRLDERVPVELTTASGDSEILQLGNDRCGPALSFDCEDLTFGTKDGHTPYELTALLETIPARFHHVGIFGTWAAVHVFGPDRVVRAIRLIAAHPAVDWVSRVTVAPGDISNAVFASALGLTVRLDFVAPVPGDGRIQARAGDWLALRYAQPSGTRLESVYQLP